MPQKQVTIKLNPEVFKKVNQKKLDASAKRGKRVTWDEFLTERCLKDAK